MTNKSHSTCQLDRLPKLCYLLGPDPPPSPLLPDLQPPGKAPSSPWLSRLLSFSQNPAQRHVCWAVVRRPVPTYSGLRSPRSGLQRPVRLARASGRVSTVATGVLKRTLKSSRATPKRRECERPGTHPAGEGRRRRGQGRCSPASRPALLDVFFAPTLPGVPRRVPSSSLGVHGSLRAPLCPRQKD